MSPIAPARARALRAAGRATLLGAIAFAGLTCRDGSPMGPGLPKWGRATFEPVLRGARSGPVIRLQQVRAQLTPLPLPAGGGAPVVDTVASFAGDELQLALSAPVVDPQQQFLLRIAATDATGDTAYSALDTVRLTIGNESPVPFGIALNYTGRDTIVATLGLAPRDTTFVVGDSVPMRAQAFRLAQQAPLAGVRFGYAVSDSAAASISTTGMLRATRAFSGIWVYTGTANGRIDSTRVSAYVPVRRVELLPATAVLAVGDTLAMTAGTFDRNDQPLTDRTVTWQSLDTTATALGNGRVIGRATGTARIVAASEGVADTSVVTIIQQPVASVTLAPDTVRLARRDSIDLVVVARDRFGNALAGRPASWASTSPTVATVSGSGRVHVLRSPGETFVIATVEGRADTAVVIALPRGAATVTIAPDSLVLVPGQQGALVVSALDAQGQPAPDLGVVWTSLDPTVATVAAGAGVAGDVTAVAVGTARIVASVGSAADTVTVRVRAAATEIRISPRADTLEIPALANDTLQLAAQAYDGGTPVAGQFDWASRAPAVAIVDSAGLVRSVANGHAWIVATERTSGLQDSVLVRVAQRVARVAVSPDSVTLPGLGGTLRYAAVAYDRNDVAVPVPGFAWTLSSAGVAVIDSIVGPHAFVRAVGAGTVMVTATADGVAGSGRYTVAQQLGSIVVNPATVDLGAGGTALLIAAGRDVNGFAFLAPLPFAWESNDPAVATVDPVTGLVTAVATGTARVTARVGGVTSNQVLVNVRALSILFEADTIAVGSRTQVAIAVRLSAPSTTPVAVGFTVSDTGRLYLEETYGQVFFPAGTTTQLLRLTGGALGDVRLVAREHHARGDCDGPCGPVSDPVYAADTAVVTVIAGIQLEARGELALGDSLYAQLALQTPAPPGGLRVTFRYDAPGLLRVVPDTVLVPEGHLAAEVLVRTLGQGVVRVTPEVVGAPEPPGIGSTIRVGPPMMELIGGLGFDAPIVIGAGQRDEGEAFALLRLPPSAALPLALSTQAGRATVDPQATVMAGAYGSNVALTGRTVGLDTIVATAPAPFGTARAEVRVTTPHVVIVDPYWYDENGDTLVVVPDDTPRIAVAAADSLGRPHPRALPLDVRVTSSDTSILLPEQEWVRLEAEWDEVDVGVRPRRSGTVTLTVTADGHVAGTRTFVVRLPRLQVYGPAGYDDTARTVRLHADRFYASDLRWDAETYSYTPFAVRVRHTNPAVATSDTLVMGDGASGYLRNVRTFGTGVDTMIVTRDGYDADTTVLLVGPPAVRIGNWADTLQLGEQVDFYVSLAGNGVQATPRTVRAWSETPGVVALDTTLTIGAGDGFATGVIPRLVGPGVATIRLSTAGAADTTYALVVRGTKLRATVSTLFDAQTDTLAVGVGQRTEGPAGQHLRVQSPVPLASPLTVSVVTEPAGLLQLPATVTINPGFGENVTLAGAALAPGLVRVIYAAAGYEPDTAWVRVTRPELYQVHPMLPATAKAGTSFDWTGLHLSDSVRVRRYAFIGYVPEAASVSQDEVVFRITSSNENVVRADSSFVHMAAGTQTGFPSLPLHFVGAGSATLTIADTAGRYPAVVRTVQVVAPRLAWNWNYGYGTPGTRATVGTRQAFSSLPQLCTTGAHNEPLQVVVTSTDTRVGRLAAGGDTVTIAATPYSWGNCVGVAVEGGDSTGTVGLVARAIGAMPWMPDTLRLVVGRPTLKAEWTLDTLFTGDTAGRGIEFTTADQHGNPRVNLDALSLEATVTAPGVMALREPIGPFVVPPGEGSGFQVRVAGLAPGTGTVRLQDRRTTLPAWQQYLPAESAPITVAGPYLRLAGALGSDLAARQENLYWSVELPDDYELGWNDTVVVRLAASDPALQVPDSVVLTYDTRHSTYFPVHGLAPGASARIVASAPGFRPDTATLVFDRGALDLRSVNYDDAMTVGDSLEVEFVAGTADGTYQAVTQAQAVSLRLPAGLEASLGGQRVTTVTIAAGTDRTRFWIVGARAGTWQVEASHPDFLPFTSRTWVVEEQPVVDAAAR